MIGDDERCVALAGLLPVRLLAERAGLTAGISVAMRRPGYHPDYDRGQVLVDLGYGPHAAERLKASSILAAMASY